MREIHTPRQNRLLAALSSATYQRLESKLESVAIALGDVLHDACNPIQHIYFPTTSIVAKLLTTANGTGAEFAVIGNEGMVGIAVFLGSESTLNQAVAVSAGYAYRLKRRFFQEELNRDNGLTTLLLRYTQTLVTQAAQSVACNRHHSLDRQLARWLLQNFDRSLSDSLQMTQDLMAYLLGFRREGITEAAGKLQRAGFIRYRRGLITVLNREGLEDYACECYATVKRECDRLLPEATESPYFDQRRLPAKIRSTSHTTPLAQFG